MWVFDGHLDLAMNALQLERDLTGTVEAIRKRESGCEDERGTAGVTLASLAAGGVRVCVATVLARAKPWIDPARAPARRSLDWPDPAMAHAVVAGQLAWYQLMERRGAIRLVRTAGDLEAALAPSDPASPPGVILTMEGADAITGPGELAWWHEQGLRTLMLAHFGKSFYAHGTPSADPGHAHDVDGPLTDLAPGLFKEMARLGVPLDLSHLSDTSFAQAADTFKGPIYASHSSCRAIVPGGGGLSAMRMLSDAQIRRIVERGGVIGLPLYNVFLKQGYTRASPKAAVTLAADVVAHARHICDIAGDAAHVAVGSDLDGGFGTEHIPAELDTAADLPRLADALEAGGFDDRAVAGITHGNWADFFRRALPAK